MSMRRIVVCLMAVACLAMVGCASKSTFDFGPPSVGQEKNNSRFYDRPVEEVWDAAIKSIGEDFFSLENIEKDSKIITLSFGVDDPADYIDCGSFTVTTSGGTSGNGTESFPFATKYAGFTLGSGGPHAFPSERRTGLTGKANIIFEALGKTQTKVTANARYIFSETMDAMVFMPYMGYMPRPTTNIVYFNSGQEGSAKDGKVICRSKYTLEQGVLDGIDRYLSK